MVKITRKSSKVLRQIGKNRTDNQEWQPRDTGNIRHKIQNEDKPNNIHSTEY